MKIKCRCCKAEFPENPILELKNMPKSAQFFPTKEEACSESGVDIRVEQCPYCGLVQLPGEPVPYFREVIRAVGFSPEMKAFRRRQYGDFAVKNHLNGDKIIEIGAGKGEYMEIMQAACRQMSIDCRVYGLEYGEDSVDISRGKGLAVYRGYLENAEFRIPDGPYDGFFSMNFLEHIPEPNSFLQAINHNLAEGAPGLIEVPNVDMMIEKRLFSEFISDHLMYFTEDTFRRILENNGFEIISCKAVWHNYILSAEVRKRGMLNMAGFEMQRKELSKIFGDFLDEKEKAGKRVAAWGAGHQALANLALLGAEKRICCVIDSAPFKQGHLTPATHIPVEAPERLRQHDIDVVVIMAASYSEEISAVMHREYPWIEAAVLNENKVILC